MSDFLNHLLDRAQGQGPQLVRRKPSLYEPRGWEPGGITEPAEEHQFRQRAPQLGEPPQPPEPPRTLQVSTEAPLPASRTRPVPAIPKEPAHQLVPRDQTAEAGPRPVDDQPPQVRVETHRSTETIRERSETRLIERRETLREPAAARQTVLERVTTLVREPATRAPQADGTIRTPLPARLVAQTVSRPSPRPSSLARPSGAVRPRVERLPALTQNQAEPAPQVTISIGRLEIRPQAGQPPTRPSKISPPQLSLDDYLRARHGGNR